MITVTRILEELFTCNLRWRIPRDIRVFTSWALRWRERIVEKKSERKREQYGVINSRTTDRENFRLIPRDIFQCSKEDSPWRKWGILGKRNFENSTRFSRFFRVRKIGRSIKISDHRSSRCTLFFFT